uniref:zinc fingers and homeoboxes protein 1-like isoform X1 n=1 Tax=Doryrhamphus excisus TaxID=161450 RepID=UPI0025ADF495|nr:zinc fingers and homeoboxes protein 1-like isoform X1 [Doryrhamphus excisus]XP_057903259.1 zinc fingers and homeoboxes protein 1-like isoform X1 [Doryrhamphus excisus]XP_057903260.1 zinc fingers and homeoboxes protein 1-like isoform X1 [Doryrhamphus excisus]XP_057903261.1 zinc fingers and homeoboxes protein 1-like isoform X1 [Doryrhamphus excisus]XP_057903262.1 zinc fingers and homeoboxes protein 1-like isoform X1 [Doryrhamphus excisus]
MASRRKSSTPCMVPPREALHSDQDTEEVTDEVESEDGEFSVSRPVGGRGYSHTSATEGGYECKYCNFRTSQLNLFTVHVDSEHPDVVTNTSYVCVECDYHTRSYDTLLVHNARHHPGEDNFTRTMVRRNNETVFQQTVNDLTFDGGFVKMEAGEGEDVCRKGIALSKTPIMRSRAEPKKFTVSHKMAIEDGIKVESQDETDEYEDPPTLSPVTATGPRLVPLSSPLHVQTVSPSFVVNSANVLHVKGGSSGGTVLPAGTLAQVLSALQNQQNQTQLLIPVSSIPAYNAAMDNNVLLVSSYNRFPYPAVSEVAALSSQTKFSEENIKVWFSAQRLKHGVSWTPEEVEEARRKKFNGTVQTIPQTITVIPAANGLQSIFQTCQIMGQPGLVLTQVSGVGGTVSVRSPVALTVAGALGNRPKAAELSTSESKTEKVSSPASFDSASKPKKSKEQLAELKASYGRRQFATEAEISRLMQVTKLSKRAIKKWFSDTRYNQRNSKDLHADSPSGRGPAPAAGAQVARGSGNDADAGDNAAAIVIDSSDDASDASPTFAASLASPRTLGDRRAKLRHAFPDFTPQKFKEKTSEQLLLLESSFRKSDTPSDDELMRLRALTKLTRREVDAWFIERRKTPQDPRSLDGKTAEDKLRPATTRERPPVTPSGRRMMKKTPEQLHILKKAFVRSQWPTTEEYDKMAEDSGLPRTYVVNWFGDTRYACKNSNLKWFYLYQSGKVDEALNGGTKIHKKSRKRFRGWSRRTRRPYPCKRSPQGGATPGQAKSGKAVLRDYYLQHGVLREGDVDALAAKSDMSEQHVRAWFCELGQRAKEGKVFSEVEEEEEEEEALEHADSEGDMDVKEQTDDDCNPEPEEEDHGELSPGGTSQQT